MKEQTRPTELAGKYQDLNHYFVSQEKIRLKLSGGGAKNSTEPTNSFFSGLSHVGNTRYYSMP